MKERDNGGVVEREAERRERGKGRGAGERKKA